MKSILVGMDGSAESLAAAGMAADLLVRRGGRLILAYVTPAGSDRYKSGGPEQGQRFLDDGARRCRRAGVTIETALLDGSAARELASFAAERNVDLVAVGHRGRSVVERLLLGSVADRLVQISPRPVLVHRPAPSADQREPYFEASATELLRAFNRDAAAMLRDDGVHDR